MTSFGPMAERLRRQAGHLPDSAFRNLTEAERRKLYENELLTVAEAERQAVASNKTLLAMEIANKAIFGDKLDEGGIPAARLPKAFVDAVRALQPDKPVAGWYLEGLTKGELELFNSLMAEQEKASKAVPAVLPPPAPSQREQVAARIRRRRSRPGKAP